MKLKLLIFVLVMLLNSCCISQKKQLDLNFKTINLTDNTSIEILPPSASGIPKNNLQTITGIHNNETDIFTGFLSITPDHIDLSVLTPMGITIFQISYTETELDWKGSFMIPKNTNGAYVIADTQIIYYPDAAVRKMIENSGLTYETKELPQGWTRKIYNRSALIIEVTKQNNRMHYINHFRKYEYIIEDSINE
ncbi:MAG: DUF3261 domain-containing protein [Fibrobacterales bacterium]